MDDSRQLCAMEPPHFGKRFTRSACSDGDPGEWGKGETERRDMGTWSWLPAMIFEALGRPEEREVEGGWGVYIDLSCG